MSLTSSWSGTQASAVYHVIATEGTSPLVSKMGITDNATTEGESYGRHIHDVECKGVKTVGREPSWCRLNSEYRKALALLFIPN